MDKKRLDSLIAEMQKSGSEDAFAEFYRLTAGGLFSFLLSIAGERAAAEDIMQDTYIKFRLNVQSYTIGTNPTAFLMQIGKRTAFNELRKRSRESRVDFSEWEIADNSPDIAEKADTTVLDAVREYLSPDEAQIIMLHIVSGFKHREIAEIVDKPLGTVLWSYNNSLKKLKKILQEKFDE